MKKYFAIALFTLGCVMGSCSSDSDSNATIVNATPGESSAVADMPEPSDSEVKKESVRTVGTETVAEVAESIETAAGDAPSE